MADSSGAVVPGATVLVLNVDTQAAINTRSNEAGAFTVPGLPVGIYNVSVTNPGFQKFSVTGLILHPAEVAAVKATLTPGEVGTTVEVFASAAQIQTTTAEVAHAVNSAQVETLPLNGRNFQALAALMPGVIPATFSTKARPSLRIRSIRRTPAPSSPTTARPTSPATGLPRFLSRRSGRPPSSTPP